MRAHGHLPLSTLGLHLTCTCTDPVHAATVLVHMLCLEDGFLVIIHPVWILLAESSST